MDIIASEDLASYPGVTGLSADQLAWTVAQVNSLITESWANPTTPVPAWVKMLALDVAARFAQNPKGLESWTRSIDDAARTERLSRTRLERFGIYLTPDELLSLSGSQVASPVGTIRTWPPCR